MSEIRTITISVVMPFHNRASTFRDAIASVLQQTRPADEIVIVDDGSRPEEAAALEDFRTQAVIVRQAPNRGVAAACNVGIDRAQCEWIAFLDDDDLWESNRLERLTQYITDHPECSAVHNAVRVTGTDSVYRKSELDLQDFLHLHPNPALRSSTMMRRSALVASGLMNQILSMDEDYDCFLRVAIHHRFHYVDEALTQRGHFGTNLSYNTPAECAAANRVLFFYQDLYPSPQDYRKYALKMNTMLGVKCIYASHWTTLRNLFHWTAGHGASRLALAWGF